ncbi:GNAT family N-acetyltransferase [Polynucleobacter sp. AP-Nino-20-G2]|uniref:GNAT family N-acetyltransferase n=1 Tax=Polynucleobacter sp. AP-Nino-20-G2 TaxID=2576917 RepID=UPI001BFE71DA|nr:GNAT family N-acetyltransferase [Polynucleobacter sp. AP-Nino-20-G2]QWE17021.1 GNAT family N-acetyltransferase [Polynucleobacter sp. AP-Nino-20-G2]
MKTSASYLEKVYPLRAGASYVIRAILPTDKERIIGLFNHLSPESRYLRFAHAISKLPDDFLEDVLDLDYQKEMALVAVIQTDDGQEEIIGIARYVTPSGQSACEFSLSVSDDFGALGIGTHLMQELISYAKSNQLSEMLGYVLSANHKMLQLVTELGFQIENMESDSEFNIVKLSLSSRS